MKLTIVVAFAVSSLAMLMAQSTPKEVKPGSFLDKHMHDTEGSFKMLGNDYILTTTTGTYTDLTGTTSLNNNQIWDDPEYILPIGFSFELYDLVTDSLYFGMGLGATVSSELDQNYEADYIVFPFEADLIDRGDISGISQSPISYKVEGTPGSRILKIEWKNAGFYDEGDSLGTLNDYINIQLWIFEGSNNIQFHYGPSMITNPNINYYGETGAMIGVSDYDLLNGYLLSGAPGNPSLVNSISFINGTPANGTIYQFTKNTSTGIGQISSSAQSIDIFPNPMQSSARIRTDINMQDADMSIYNLQGQLVKREDNLSGDSFVLDRENLPEGMYVVRITANNGMIATNKLIVRD